MATSATIPDWTSTHDRGNRGLEPGVGIGDDQLDTAEAAARAMSDQS
jgi:hypothetical protein